MAPAQKAGAIFLTEGTILLAVDKLHDFLGAAIGTEHVLDLVLNQFLDVGTAISHILARVEVLRMSHKVLANTSRESQAQVGVDVDFANCGFSSLAELIFRNTNSIVQLAAVSVDDLNVLRNNGRSTMENDRELRNLLLDFSENVETQFGRYENAFSIARALFRLELECTMGSTDSDSQRIYASLFDEFFYFFRLRVSCFVSSNLNIIFDTSQFTQLSFYANAMFMSVSNNFLRTFDVLFEIIVRTIEHYGSETVIDASFAGFEICAMVEVQSNGNVVNFQSSLNEVTEIRALCIFASTSRCLQDNRGVQLSSCFRDTLYDFHVVYVESTDSVAAFVSFLEHFFSSN